MKLIKPTDSNHWLKMRAENINSSEVAALFGLSPYQTEFELWHRKKNKEVVILKGNDRMTWGNRLESAIALGVAEDHNLDVKPFKDYGLIEEDRTGSSFDFAIYNKEGAAEGMLEIKNVDSLQYKDKWIIEDGEVVEAPAHIELQVQHQLLVTGFEYAHIAALVGGNRVTMLKRKKNEKIIALIKSKIKKFWESVDSNTPPSPDFVKDANFISELYCASEPGSVLDAEGDANIEKLVIAYQEAAAGEKEFAAQKKAAKAQLLIAIGDHEKVMSSKFSISAGITAPSEIAAYTRKGFRNFRVYKKKGKK